MANQTWGRIGKLGVYVGIGIYTFIALSPFYWGVIVSLRSEVMISSVKDLIFPGRLTLQNYADLFNKTRFIIWYQNSLVVSITTTFLTVLVSGIGAYSLGRLKFPGRNQISSMFLMTYLVPSSVLFIPILILIVTIGLRNSLVGLVLANLTFTVPFCTWLLIGFFKTIPLELEDAARMDGATRLQAFVKVILPLARPGLMAAVIFSFVLAWHEFIYALVIIVSDSRRTLPVGLSSLMIGDVFLWGQLMAAAVLVSVPIGIVFILFQRYYFVSGLTGGSVKG